MKRNVLGAGIAGVIFCVGFGAIDTAQANCYNLLGDRNWQRAPVCNNTYRSAPSSGANYSGAIGAGIAAAGIAAELLPDILNGLGDVTSGVGDITSNVAPNFNNPLESFLSGANQHGSNNDGTLNPFNLFNQQPETPAAKKKNAKQDETVSLFPNIFAPQVNTPNPTVRTPHVNTPDVTVRAPEVNTPLFPNIFAPQVNTPNPTVRAPNVNTPNPTVRTPAVHGYDPMVQ